MVAETDPEHVVDLALIPIGSSPDRSHRIDLRRTLRSAAIHPALHAQAGVPLDGVEGLGGNAESAYVIRDGKVAVVAVTTGVQTPTRVAILSGLKEGDIVIVGRHTNLSDGETVNPQPARYENEPASHS